MRLSLFLAAMLLATPAYAQSVNGAAPSATGVWGDLDSSGNIVTVYGGPQPQNPTTEWFPINDVRVQAFYGALSAKLAVPTGAQSTAPPASAVSGASK